MKTKKIKKSIAFLLILITAFSNTAVPLSYAQQTEDVKNPPKVAGSASLITETDSSKNLPLALGTNSVNLEITNASISNASADKFVSAKVRKLSKKHYRPNEEIQVVIDNGRDTPYETELVDQNGTKVALDTEEVITGDAKIITVTQPSSFRPGKYKLRITDNKGGVSEQDFSWGVLAINPDKSIYAPFENANLAIAVLDERGDMVCDAQVELGIKNQE